MAPTEIVAKQHYRTLSKLFDILGITVALLIGSTKAAEKKAVQKGLADGSISVAIGTHALISGGVEFLNLGLAVTDEQHRFGVLQRSALQKKGHGVHQLIISATPIPRTLALTLYGDLSLSALDELPPGRQRVETYVIDSGKRERAYGFIRDHLAQGRQAYIVCPLIDDSEVLPLSSVTRYFEETAQPLLSGFKTAYIHGRLKRADMDGIMEQFTAGEIDAIVATTVIEVGVDTPNAVIMLIENADRFGLSALHQLRGRVGRGQHKSYCIMVSDSKSVKAKERLSVMREESDGLIIAERDLTLRGPGDFFGTVQHGLPQFKIADLSEDLEPLKEAADTARNWECEVWSAKLDKAVEEMLTKIIS
jgi:ATP-dependent DNA helicase RecG